MNEASFAQHFGNFLIQFVYHETFWSKLLNTSYMESHTDVWLEYYVCISTKVKGTSRKKRV